MTSRGALHRVRRERTLGGGGVRFPYGKETAMRKGKDWPVGVGGAENEVPGVSDLSYLLMVISEHMKGKKH